MTTTAGTAVPATTAVAPQTEYYQDASKGLDVVVHKQFLDREAESALYDEIKDLAWYRVKYKSERHGNSCETPCWTNMFGGLAHIKLTGARFNAILTRLYFDGRDNIAWHTDARAFLGPTPVIASLSLGASSQFELRRMTDVWPTTSTPHQGIDKQTSQVNVTVCGGDLMIMQGQTQQQWHHRVPKATHRGPRININFRCILLAEKHSASELELAIRGIRAFYKYMVAGDDKTDAWDITAPSFTYSHIEAKCAPLRHMFKSTTKNVSSDKLPTPLLQTQEKALSPTLCVGFPTWSGNETISTACTGSGRTDDNRLAASVCNGSVNSNTSAITFTPPSTSSVCGSATPSLDPERNTVMTASGKRSGKEFFCEHRAPPTKSHSHSSIGKWSGGAGANKKRKVNSITNFFKPQNS